EGRPAGVLPTTPYSLDLEPYAASANPSAASPRLSNSRTADARLGMRFLNRKSSRTVTSSGDSMIWRRSPRIRFGIVMRSQTGEVSVKLVSPRRVSQCHHLIRLLCFSRSGGKMRVFGIEAHPTLKQADLRTYVCTQCDGVQTEILPPAL